MHHNETIVVGVVLGATLVVALLIIFAAPRAYKAAVAGRESGLRRQAQQSNWSIKLDERLDRWFGKS